MLRVYVIGRQLGDALGLLVLVLLPLARIRGSSFIFQKFQCNRDSRGDMENSFLRTFGESSWLIGFTSSINVSASPSLVRNDQHEKCSLEPPVHA